MSYLNIDLSSIADDDFFGSLKDKSSKLQQLFVDEALTPDDKEQSLKYERLKGKATTSNATSTTLMAKVVTAYKQGELQGKVGLALVQNPDDICNLIIYKTKENILASLKLQRGIDSFYKQKTYWQFYDQNSTYWSFSFDNTTDEKDFVDSLDKKQITFRENHESEPVPQRHLELQTFALNEDYKNKTSTIETKNSVIKRVAKMGKPLPTLCGSQQTTTEFSDSSDTEVIQTPMSSIQKPSIVPRNNKIISAKSNQHLVSSSVDLNSVASSVYPINHLESQYMQMLLSEQRTQGSEMRMNMNKLENKIEKVLDKLEFCDRNYVKKDIGKDDEILELEEKLLALKKENRKLKQNLQQHSLEQSNENQIQECLIEFKEDFKKLNINYSQGFKNILFELCDRIKEKSNAMQNLEKKFQINEKELEKTSWELELISKKNCELQNEISLLNQKEYELSKQLNQKEGELTKQKREILDLQKMLEEKNSETSENPNDDLIKSLMNNLFVDIAEKLNNGSFSQSEQILSLIANSIKQQTLETLQKSLKNSI